MLLFVTEGGMQRNYLQVKQFLESKFPELQGKITGGTYPPPPYASFLSSIVMVLQAATILWFLVGGDKVFLYLGYTPQTLPPIYYTIQENSFALAMAVFLIIPQLFSKLIVTGAFEVYLENTGHQQIIHSKIATGNFPTADDLIAGFVQAGFRLIK
jgi:selT/selW/selH-like putative selenoprotein